MASLKLALSERLSPLGFIFRYRLLSPSGADKSCVAYCTLSRARWSYLAPSPSPLDLIEYWVTKQRFCVLILGTF